MLPAFSRTNLLIRKFAKCSIEVKLFLFRTYCINFYEIFLWRRCNNITVLKIFSRNFRKYYLKHASYKVYNFHLNLLIFFGGMLNTSYFVWSPFYCVLAYWIQDWSLSQISWWYSSCCKTLESKKLTRLRSKLLGGMFFVFMNSGYGTQENWDETLTVNCCFFSIVSFHCTCAKKI